VTSFNIDQLAFMLAILLWSTGFALLSTALPERISRTSTFLIGTRFPLLRELMIRMGEDADGDEG